MEQSDFDRLQRERDNWKASAISAIERAEKAEADVERLRKAAEIACKHWRQKSDMFGAAMDALCDHVGIVPCL